MKKGNISQDQFSYKEDYSLRFNNSNYILAVKDEDFPDRNIIPLLYYNNGNVTDIDMYDMERVLTTKNSNLPEQTLSRFNVNQIVKVSFGNIIRNERYFEGSNFPKCITFASNIHQTDKNDVVEILGGKIDEAKSRVKFNETILESLIIDVYIEEDSPVFIETEDAIVGPFKIIEKDLEGYFNVEKHLWKTFGKYKITDNTYIEFTANDIDRKIHLPSFNGLDILTTLDFKDDNEIIKQFKNRLADSPETFSLIEQENLLEIINRTSKLKSLQTYIQDNYRLQEILKNSKNIVVSDKELALIIPELTGIKSKLESLQSEEFELRNKVQIVSKRNEEIQQEISEKQVRLDQLNSELENLSKTKEEELLKIKSELETDIAVLQAEKNNIEIQIRDETEIKSKELISVKEQLDNLKKEKDDLDYTVTELKQDNKRAQLNAQQELINLFKHKKYFDFLSGRDLSEFEKEEERSFVNFSIEDSYGDYLQFRKDFISILSKNGRVFDTHFIDNLLISIHQNTLTILAGLPGTGKTSLARLITKILSPINRISEVSVSRGWTSQKDLIGFHNPLTNKFHSAPTGVYELLSQLDHEVRNKTYKESPMCFIILDEANLSPIEHYWSTFYNLTDSVARTNNYLNISLGNNINLQYANNLRFIATINYDQTTESLSPRVIDRANVIQIPTPSAGYNIDTYNIEDIERLKLSFEKSIIFFKLLDFAPQIQSFELTDELNAIFNDIKRKFKALKLPISPRVEISIKRYCFVAKDWMKKEISRPLDYCIAQRLFPMINLQGDAAKNNLVDLLDILEKNDLKKSSEILRKIIETGDEDSIFEGTYNYFLTLSHA